jgi:tetratricopeptide (TPR) repeat protein
MIKLLRTSVVAGWAMAVLCVQAHVLPVPMPEPDIRIIDLRANEQPVKVETVETELENNGLFRKVETRLEFTNPNRRTMSGELEFPLPEGAVVCGYALEVDGTMVPGVVTEKEKARVAFESEKAKGVDPGLVEQVKGNVWKTRIFPLNPGKTRKAAVTWVAPVESDVAEVYERDGDEVFAGTRAQASGVVEADLAAGFARGAILWDGSRSAEGKAARWREKLSTLPEAGEWTLMVFRNDLETAGFTTKAELLNAIKAVIYDGGTDIGSAIEAAGESPALLFTDEIDTLGTVRPKYEEKANIVIMSREQAVRPVQVRKLKDGEEVPEGVEVKESKLLATIWAANRMEDLASQSGERKDEFLALGRKYGVAGAGTSLIVLEGLEQYLTHQIEPPEAMAFHDEWVRRMLARDEEIEKSRNDLEHKAELLRLWEERVNWWNSPVPHRETPSSGLFDDEVEVAAASGANRVEPAPARMRRSAARSEEAMVACSEMPDEEPVERSVAKAGGGGATITIKPWTSNAPYLKTIDKAEDKYAAYIKERTEYGASPAFYMDVASLFFRQGENRIAKRILSNMAEFKLEDAAVWRSMGWRLREAGEYEATIRCFAQALRLRSEEGQARRDLALVLSEHGKKTGDAAELAQAMALLKDAAFVNWARRSSRRSNDRQVSIIALEELNALIAWCEKNASGARAPEMEAAFRRDLPVKIRIALSWDADETDIDIHVLEPDGEEAFYRNRRTSTGGFVGEDVTTGYGPEEYLRKEGTGKFRILANYFASHQTDLTGAVTATATVYTDWGTEKEQMQMLTMRLDKPKEKVSIGEVEVK